MLKIMHISDFKIDSPQPFMLPEAAEKRKKDIFEALIDFCEKASEHEPDAILISGNLIDLSSASTENILKIIDIFNNLTMDSKIHLFMVSGPIEFSGVQYKNSSYLNSFVRNQYIHVFPDTKAFSSVTVKSKNDTLFSVYGKSYDSSLKKLDALIPDHGENDIPAILLTPALPQKLSNQDFINNLPILNINSCLEKNFTYMALGGIERRILSEKNEWAVPGAPERLTLSGEGGIDNILQISIENSNEKWISNIKTIPLKIKEIIDLSVNLDLSVFSISDMILKKSNEISNKAEKILYLELTGEISFDVFKRYDRIKLIKKLLKLFHNVILINNMTILDPGSMDISKHPFSPDPKDVFNNIINEKISEAGYNKKNDFKTILIHARELGNKIINQACNSEYGDNR